jgi:hypothetical protein
MYGFIFYKIWYRLQAHEKRALLLPDLYIVTCKIVFRGDWLGNATKVG